MNTTLKPCLFVLTLSLPLAGCATTPSPQGTYVYNPRYQPDHEPPAPPAPPPPRPASNNGCAVLLQLTENCHAAGSQYSCDQVNEAMQSIAREADLPPSAQANMGSLCQSACQARQRGVSWSVVRSTVVRNCR